MGRDAVVRAYLAAVESGPAVFTTKVGPAPPLAIDVGISSALGLSQRLATDFREALQAYRDFLVGEAVGEGERVDCRPALVADLRLGGITGEVDDVGQCSDTVEKTRRSTSFVCACGARCF